MQNLELYKRMFLIRTVEQSLLNLFSQGLLTGTVHTCIGQEACSVGVFSVCDLNRDIFFSNHRGHGHFLSYTNDPKGLIAEVMGKKEGICGGLGGSQHLQTRNLYTNGIQGAGMPIVAGMALSEKIKNTKAIATVFIGDGTFGEGLVYETLNIASLWKLPILIVVENNRYAQTTPVEVQHAGLLVTRGDTFNIETIVSDGMNVLEVAKAARELINKIREDSTPRILHLNTYRYSPHSKGDDFRDNSEIDRYKLKDPLLQFKIGSSGIDFEVIETEIIDHVNFIINDLITN
jgi:TPP-dependent pyruvate/acetoin dehydrogenase alpha subunit